MAHQTVMKGRPVYGIEERFDEVERIVERLDVHGHEHNELVSLGDYEAAVETIEARLDKIEAAAALPARNLSREEFLLKALNETRAHIGLPPVTP